MVLYTNNAPQATQTVAFTQPLIQSNFLYLPLWASKDHYFSSDSADVSDGFHTKVTFKANMGAPGIAGGVSAAYSDVVNGEAYLCWQNALGSYAMNCINPGSGVDYAYTSLPGGVVVQVGYKANAFSNSSSTGSSGSVNYPITFFNKVLYVGMTPIDTSGSASGSIVVCKLKSGYDSNLTGFDYSYTKSQSSGSVLHMVYFAVGM